MIQIRTLDKDLYTFPIPLPNNPLKWLNCYVIKGSGGERNLLIDTGFFMPECQEALDEGMRELDLDPEKTDVFLTHLHSDHSGNARYLKNKGSRVLMGRIDYDRYMDTSTDHWLEGGKLANREGMPWDHLRKMFHNNREVSVTSGGFRAELLENGDLMQYNNHLFECVMTPGHTPGHMCLYDRNSKAMILGDHVLFDISPNITFWAGVKNPLGDYLKSLKDLRRFDIQLGLPGHRNLPGVPVQQRVDELLAHHDRRLANMLYIIENEPGLNAYEIAGKMRWRIHAKSWEDFPPSQQYFAVGETIAHLDYLIEDNKIRREVDSDGNSRYFIQT